MSWCVRYAHDLVLLRMVRHVIDSVVIGLRSVYEVTLRFTKNISECGNGIELRRHGDGMVRWWWHWIILRMFFRVEVTC